MAQIGDKFLMWVDMSFGQAFFGAFESEDAAYDALAAEGIHHDDVSDCEWLDAMDPVAYEDWKDVPLGQAF